MTNIKITEHPEQMTAVVRERVPMAELTGFFSRAFEQTLRVLREQGVHAVGAPFGKYYGQPDTTVDVEAGFPVSETIAPVGEVVPGVLPGGSMVETTYVGPYDTMDSAYSALERYFAENGLVQGDVMWESYLTDPEEEPDPAKWETRISWPVA
jgi:effector-binding domain-containing protein